MPDYEKGSAAWDIAQILTRHYAPLWPDQPCARVTSLRSTVGVGMNAPARLMSALETACTCGSGDDESEQTSLKKEADAASNSSAALPEESTP